MPLQAGFAGSWTPIGAATDPYRVNQTPKQATWQTGEYAATPTGQAQLEAQNNRAAAFTRYNQLAGIDPNSGLGRNIQSKFGQISNNYEAFLAEQPNTSFQDYYNMILPQLQQAFLTGSDAERGGQITRFVRPARTIGRA